jgi:hypothetical protein
MTEDDNSKLVDMDNLDTFEKHFFELEDSDDKEDEVDEDEDDSLATDDDKDADEEEIETPSEDEDEDEEDDPEEDKKPEPKPKSKAQKRIEELVTTARVAERERDAEKRERELLERRLAEIEARSEVKDDKTVRSQLPPEAPNPDATDEKGEAVYPLGEFDPTFIRDLTRFTIQQETAKVRKEAEEREAAQKLASAQRELTDQFTEKLTKVEEDLPDIREKITELTDTFRDVDPAYGDYLATAIMSCEYGPEVMYYLSQNIGEAQKIVASGPFAATLAIAKIDAKLAKAPVVEDEEKRNKKKVSEAPPIPINRPRGKGGQFTVPADTNDLDAFERMFFKSK